MRSIQEIAEDLQNAKKRQTQAVADVQKFEAELRAIALAATAALKSGPLVTRTAVTG